VSGEIFLQISLPSTHSVNGSPLRRVALLFFGENDRLSFHLNGKLMGQNGEKHIYSITLKSEDDEEVKVIDRLHIKNHKNHKKFLTQTSSYHLSNSSSMDETRKRKICCGLSSCCGKTRSESAQMIAGKSSTQPLTMGQKCGNCCCWPFRKISNPFKRRKVDSMDAMKNADHEKPSMWERICCCSGCCRRCRKGNDLENMAKVSDLLHEHYSKP
jgi:hypothetical protein